MNAVLAFIRHDMLTQASYRINTVLAFAGLAFIIVPLYFVSGALQPVMATSIASEGGHYFSFVLLGMVAFRFVTAGASTLPGAIGSGIRTGTLEMMFATPVPRFAMLSGMLGYRVLWSLAEAVVMMIAGALLGAHFFGTHWLTAILIVGLITLTYAAIGVLAASLLLAFRTCGPLLSFVSMGSIFFGGVYYPGHVIPSWLQHLSAVIPLTYGLRALRQTLLTGASLAEVAPDVGILAGMAMVLAVLSACAFDRAVAYARRTGTLAQY